MEKFCLITNKNKDPDLEITNKVVEYIRKNNRECTLLECTNGSGENCFLYTDKNTIPKDTDCIIVLGGDGTILQAAYDTSDTDIPILGINAGTLGFLAEIETHGIYEALDNIFKDDYTLEYRMMLEVYITRDKEVLHKGKSLNEIVVARSGFSRIISLSVYVNGELANKYRGDGIIVATPTGSTGYNLSAGGPVITPNNQVIVITPICPHSLNSRSIVISEEDEIVVKVETSKKTQNKEVLATFDGHEAIQLNAEDVIEIKKSKKVTKFIKFKSNNFFETLRSKLGYSEDNFL